MITSITRASDSASSMRFIQRSPPSIAIVSKKTSSRPSDAWKRSAIRPASASASSRR